MRSQYEFYTPYVAIWWKRYPNVSLEAIKRLGFDGIEVFLIGNMLDLRNITAIKERAKHLGLGIRFHQGWSWTTGQRIFINRILRMMGALTPEGLTEHQQLFYVEHDSTVVYANHSMNAFKSPRNHFFQSASEYGKDGAYLRTEEEFFWFVQRKNLGVVFDTQHYLEWSANAHHVSDLSGDSKELTRHLLDGWQKYRPFVKEIHLCDSNPRLGSQAGRNVFPGTGVLDLREFASAVKESDWSGIITPEVRPEFVKNEKQLGKLFETVRGYFE